MIGYYAHHVGAGHLTRAALFATHAAEPVTLLGTRASADPSVFADVVTLERDDEVPISDISAEHGAHGALHWAPLGPSGYADRMARLAEWVCRTRPRAVVVDVSTEVAALVRSLGVPVVVVAQPGDRPDDPHELARRCASAIVAPWPPGLYEPDWLVPHLDRATFAGAMSRFRDREVTVAPEPRSVLVLAGGDGVDGLDLDDVRDATPGWTWRTAGVTGHDWHDDLWPALCAAEIVVTHGGQNAVADVATAGRPAVVVAAPRPHDEQRTTARVLDAHGIAVGLTGWPEPEEWPDVLERACRHGGAGWSRWALPDAVETMVEVVGSVGRG